MNELGFTGKEHDIPTIGVEGVGEHGQKATRAVTMEGHVKSVDGALHSATYQAPIINESDIPALWGHRSLAHNRSIIDTINRRLFLCGPGDIKFTPPPGTITLNLELSSSGHVLLPFTEAPSSSTSPRRRQRLDLNFSSVPLQGQQTTAETESTNGGAPDSSQ